MIYKGNAVSEGIAIGKVLCYEPFIPHLEEKEITNEQVEESLKLFDRIHTRSRQELSSIINTMKKSGNNKSKILQAHIDILEDEVLLEEIHNRISTLKNSPDWAIDQTFGNYIKILSESKDPLIRERTSDLEDVRNRLLRKWYGVKESDLSNLSEPVVVVAHDLLPSDTATLDRKNVLAIITEIGGETSHSAIIARSYQIPAILGVSGALTYFQDGEAIVVDAMTGHILTEPNEKELDDYANKRKEYLLSEEMIKLYIDKPACTKDGFSIGIGLNIGGFDDEMHNYQKYVDMVGLFRTEFLYMNSNQLPTEEQQYEAYRKILLTYRGKPVILRTLDVGGDKSLPCLPLPKEDNPFLGKRALRLCFDQIELFKTQLRAALRASIYGDLWIMFPMVGSLEDIRKAKFILEEVKQELQNSKIAFMEDVKVGIMIEIPSIAIMAEKVVDEVDFASIGTNDLCQYLLAVDRVNPEVSSYYQRYHPALFALIGYVAKKFNAVGKPISVCGELGGDELAAPILIGLGIHKLSMNFSSVAKIKKKIFSLTMEQMRTFSENILAMDTSFEVEQYLKKIV